MSGVRIERAFRAGSRLTAWFYTKLLASQFHAIGSGSRISPPFRFANLRNISLGKNVFVGPGCWIHAVGAPKTGAPAALIIESHAGIGMGATISAAEQVIIGEYVLLARNVFISDHSHAFENIPVPIMHQGIDHIKPVKIGRHSWLGQNVVVLPGATIGEHCVVGANSVVNSDIPGYSVAVGIPARVVKKYNSKTCEWERVS